jgi:toxin-antitoxin system PIN domain toxin
MILPDANLLLYAYDAASPFHSKAAAWWSGCLSRSEPVGLCVPVLFAFIRIGTSNRAFAEPMTVDEEASHVEEWMNQPVSQILESDIEDIRKAFEFLRGASVGGNLTSDAQLAALSLRYRGVVHSADSDFARFLDVRWHNPLLE